MLRRPDESDQATAVPARIIAFDRARTFITLLVLLHHSVVNYTHFGSGDRMRWLGFDLVVLFNDSFFMACMFFIAGLFVRDSLARRGSANFLGHRAFRLGVPFLISIFVLMPLAYYPTFLRYHLPGTTDFNFFHFWWHTLTIGPWPSGPAWFLWVLLALDAIAAAIWFLAPRALDLLGRPIYALRYRPGFAFVGFLMFSIIVYLPMHLIFGDASWLEPAGAKQRTGKPLEDMACLCAAVLRRDPAVGLRAPQLDRGFQLAAARVADRIWPRLCDVQRRDDVRGAGVLFALRKVQPPPARRAEAFGLRHLPAALHLHHLAAICPLRSTASGVREVCDRVYRRAVAELGAHPAVTEDSVGSADDLGPPNLVMPLHCGAVVKILLRALMPE